MIKSFKNKETAKIFKGQHSNRFPSEIQARALRKLILLNQATTLHHLKSLPANRLEYLTGNRQGQNSIRINKQWRICFHWESDGAYNVEIIDYH